MRPWHKRRLILAAMLFLGLLRAAGQSTPAGHSAVTVGSRASSAVLPAGSVSREIDDPCIGARWLLVRDPAHPEGPGRLVLRASSAASEAHAASGAAGGQTHSAAAQAQAFVIHSGDALLVEEHTAVVDAQLEATALSAAVRGAEFKARLRIGGKVVRVLAIGPGRAAFVREKGPRP